MIAFLLLISLSLATQPVPTKVDSDDAPWDVYMMTGMIQRFEKWEKLFGRLKVPPHAPSTSLHQVYHGSIGMRNRLTNEAETYEYYPTGDVLHGVFPVVSNPGPTCTIKWENRAIVDYSQSIDDKLWLGGEVKVASITNDQRDKFRDWASVYNSTSATDVYYLFKLVNPHSGDVYNKQSQCFDFCEAGFAAMAQFGVQFNQSAQVRRMNVILDTKQPELVDANDPSIWKEMCQWYEDFQFKGFSIWEEIVKLAMFPGESKFVYSFGSYYRLHFVLPFAHWEYVPFQLPK